MTFEEILPLVKRGHRARRHIWRSVDRHHDAQLFLATPVLAPDVTLMPQLLIDYGGTIIRPFAGANWDLLADDWELVQP